MSGANSRSLRSVGLGILIGVAIMAGLVLLGVLTG